MLDITTRIPDKYEQNYVTALILGLAGQIISKEQRNHLPEVLKITDALREFEQETLEKGRKEGIQKGLTDVAKKMLSKGSSIADVKEMTGLSETEVEEIKKQLN